MAHYEIEIKSLLGKTEQAEALKAKMTELDPEHQHVGSSSQLNHYFAGGNLAELYTEVEHLFSADERARLQKIVSIGSDFSVRTRKRNDEVLLVVKASVGESSSENGVSRLEFEESVSLTLDELDALVLQAGFDYQAKWSRDREEYSYKGANVCIDYNAGYGYVAEFEKITDDEDSLPHIEEELATIMAELNVEPLDQGRLARMFDHYNTFWRDYYGTEKTFVIE